MVAGGGNLESGAVDLATGGGDEATELGAAKGHGLGAGGVLIFDPSVLVGIGNVECPAVILDFHGEIGVEFRGGVLFPEDEILLCGSFRGGIGAGVEDEKTAGDDGFALEPSEGIAPTSACFLLRGEEGGAGKSAAEKVDDDGDAENVIELGG